MNFDELISKALHHFELAKDREHSALIQAVKCGKFLNRAKTLWRKRKSEKGWLKVLRKFFKKGKRTAQDYMQIAEGWSRIIIYLEKNPKLSIAGALRILRSGSPELSKDKKRSWDVYEFEMGRIRAATRKGWKPWPKEFYKWLKSDPFLLQSFYEMVILECAPREMRRKYLGRKNETLRRLEELEIQLWKKPKRLIWHKSGFKARKRRSKYSVLSLLDQKREIEKCDMCRYRNELGPFYFSALLTTLQSPDKPKLGSQNPEPEKLLPFPSLLPWDKFKPSNVDSGIESFINL